MQHPVHQAHAARQLGYYALSQSMRGHLQLRMLLQSHALCVTVSGAEFEVSGEALACSSVLRELSSAADDAAVHPTLPLSSSAFSLWIQGVDEAPEVEWNAFLQVLQVGSCPRTDTRNEMTGTADKMSGNLEQLRRLYEKRYVRQTLKLPVALGPLSSMPCMRTQLKEVPDVSGRPDL